MKRIFLLLLLAAAGFWAWRWTNRLPEELPSAGSPAAERSRRLAPHGVFYLTEYASLRTPQGVIGFEPGQEVRFVSATGSTLTVTDGKYRIEVQPRQLTDDLDIAALVRHHDETSQRQLASFRAAELAAYERNQRELNKAHAAHVEAFNREQRDAGAVGHGNALNKPARAAGGSAGGPSYGSSYGGAYNYLQSPGTAPGSTSTPNPRANGYNVNDWNR